MYFKKYILIFYAFIMRLSKGSKSGKLKKVFLVAWQIRERERGGGGIWGLSFLAGGLFLSLFFLKYFFRACIESGENTEKWL